MKWVQEEIDITVDLLQSGFTYDQIGKVIGRSRNSVRIKCGRIGNGFEKYKRVEVKECLHCTDKIEKFGTKFCSRSCSASFNNKLRPKNINRPETNERVNAKKRNIYHERKQKSCLNCSQITTNKYCNASCQQEYRFKDIVNKIETGDVQLPVHTYRKYLINKYGAKCMVCGWGEVNPTSGKIPIELEHIDGNSDNNRLDNLKLLCPNCHSLTPTYKVLNKGNGRHSRMERYHEGKSF